MKFLSPFIYNVFITTYYKHRGKIPHNKDVGQTRFKHEKLVRDLILNKLLGISSYPRVF